MLRRRAPSPDRAAARRRARAAVLALAVAALAVVPATTQAAGPTWVVRGRGFGHGVGMSAYGAYGYALHGWGYRAILAHYYQGTTIATLPQRRVVRVLLSIDRGEVAFSGARRACGRALDPARSYAAQRRGNTVQLRVAGGRALAACGPRLHAAGVRGRVEITGLGTYRGALEVVPTRETRGSLNVVNAVPVDQYVKGVIPNESPPSWPRAELEAQAVASRSFALAAGVGGNGFDLYADTRSQVYKGLASEYPSSNAAAEATRGEVLEYHGQVAEAFFSACSGGHTENVQNVFGGPPVPYLQGVPDPYDGYCPLHSWRLRFNEARIDSLLAPYLKGRLQRVVVTERGVTPRIVAAKLVGSGGVSAVSGEQLETALGTYSTWMSFRRVAARGAQPSG